MWVPLHAGRIDAVLLELAEEGVTEGVGPDGPPRWANWFQWPGSVNRTRFCRATTPGMGVISGSCARARGRCEVPVYLATGYPARSTRRLKLSSVDGR